MKQLVKEIHPEGEKTLASFNQNLNSVPVDTYGGPVHIEWDHDTPITPHGQLAFFIEFLKRTKLFDHWVRRCPLTFTSPNAPKVRDVLGTLLLSVLPMHSRYAHITAIRTDKVNAPLLGLSKLVSKDLVRRCLKTLDPTASKT